MADIRTLKLALLADTKDFIKGLDKADKESRSFSSKLGTALKAGALAFAALGAAAGAMAIKIGKDAIGAASDFSEEISKSRVIFGEASKDIEDFAKTAANSLGQSKKQAVSAASTFATLGKAAGLTGKDLSKFSIGFVKLASDLASFNNTSPEDAIQAIGAALRGEAEPIRRYGILLNDATLKNEALALGLIKSTKEALSPANKVLAAQAAIYKQTADAQGDFGRTSDGLANSQRILAANIEDVKITLGESLLPVALKFSDFLKKDLVPAIKGLVDGLTGQTKKAVVPSLGMFQEKTEDAESAGYSLGEAIRDLGKGLGSLGETFNAETSNESGFVRFINLLTSMVNGLDSLFAKLDAAVQKFRDFKTAFDNSLIGQFAGATGTFAPENAPVNTLRQSTGITGSRTPTVIVNNNIKTAVDPQATARAITKVTNSAFKTTGISFIRPQFR
jgi:hypothetical protein